jgi:hypothetical protein
MLWINVIVSGTPVTLMVSGIPLASKKILFGKSFGTSNLIDSGIDLGTNSIVFGISVAVNCIAFGILKSETILITSGYECVNCIVCGILIALT